MNKRAQGLPLNFIVLAAIAILILILVVGFVVAGGSSFAGAVSPAAFSANCKQICSEMQIKARGVDYQSDSQSLSGAVLGMGSMNAYCANQSIKGQSSGQICEQIEPCYVTYKNNVQKLVICP